MDIELVNHIKNQVIEELKKDYFLISKTDSLDVTGDVESRIFILYVTDIVCKYFRLDKTIVFSDTRKTPYPETRYLIFIICRYHFEPSPISFAKIADVFDKDHSTVMAGINKGLNLAQVHKQYNYDLIKLKEIVKLGLTKNK